MNAARGDRGLRQRQRLNYSLAAMEAGFGSDDEDDSAGPRARKKAGPKGGQAPVDLSSDGDDGDGAYDAGADGAAAESEAAGSGDEASEDEEESEDQELRRSRRTRAKRPAPEPVRRQPARQRSAAAKSLREASESGGEASDSEEEAPRGRAAAPKRHLPRRSARQPAPKRRAGGRGSEGSDSEGSESPAEARGPRRRSERAAATRGAKRAAAAAASDSGSEDGGSEGESAEESEGESPPQPARKAKAARFDLGAVAKVLDARGSGAAEEAFVSLRERSYRHARWVLAAALLRDERTKRLLQTFLRNRAHGEQPEEGWEHGVCPDWLTPERVLACERGRDGQPSYLIKWRGLGYSEATWEAACELRPGDQEHVEAFEAREALEPPTIDPTGVDPEAVPAFRNGRQLRDYQVESLKWMVNNMRQLRNCILGDEMGLGKTAQSISVLEYQRQLLGVRGPFLVIAPLTTLGHWQREIETWTGMYVVQYCGGKEDREAIKRWEFSFASGRPGKQVKFDVLLTSYELLLKDKALFQAFGPGKRWPAWQTVVYDEAHRLKALRSKNREVADGLHARWKLLLTGTPVQNNMREVFGLLSALDGKKWDDEGAFLETYGGEGGPPSVAQIRALQEQLRPILLRRMKEDVETLPQKEEVVVWVELTRMQQAYYKALLAKQIGTLLAGAGSKQLPQMRNLAMELRKLCCHPYLCDGLEDDIHARTAEAGGGGGGELADMLAASGKMVLLHKLLHKLRGEGRKVLIFSQFKIMLDVIEDSLALAKLPLERIDGDTHQSRRQAAIDRFMAGGDDAFAFLLSTRAGGQGITLTAADTVVIYDSDWNPQNDLQAMARCHRIGQSKEVTVYRLICKDTYEQQLFDAASLKYGLDGAILGGGGGGGANPEQDASRIESLLLRGAHGLVGQAAEAAKAAEGEAFANEDIEQTLARRTERRTVGSRAGNTFSTATFAAEPGKEGGSARDIWSAILPDEVAAFEAKKAKGPTPLGKRKRSRVNYADSPAARARRARRDGEEGSTATGTGTEAYGPSPSDSDTDAEVEGGPLERQAGSGRGRGRAPSGDWSKAQVKRAQECLVTWGPDAFEDPRPHAGLEDRPLGETQALLGALQQLSLRAFAHTRSLADLQQEIRMLATDLEYAPSEDVRAKLGEARRKLAALQATGLSLEGLAVPAPCLAAVQQLRDYWLGGAARHHPHIQERAVLGALLRKAAAGSREHAVVLGNACLRTRRGLGRTKAALPPGWGLAQDAQLLHASHAYGLRPHAARAALEQVWRDPACGAFCGRLEGEGAPAWPGGEAGAVQRPVSQPPLAPVLTALRGAFRLGEEQPRYEVPDAAAFKRLSNTLLERLRALLTSLLEAHKEFRDGGCRSPMGQPRAWHPSAPAPLAAAAAAAAAATGAASSSRAHPPVQGTLGRLGFQHPQQQRPQQLQQPRAPPPSLQTLVPASGARLQQQHQQQQQPQSSLLRHLSPVRPAAAQRQPPSAPAAAAARQPASVQPAQQQRPQQPQQQQRRGEVIDLSDSESEPEVVAASPARPVSAQPSSAPRQASAGPSPGGGVGGMRTKPPAGSPGKKMRQQTLAFQRVKPPPPPQQQQ